MEQTPPVVTVRFNRFLPYWAVFQTDMRQTLRGWTYRLWVLVTVLAAAGFLLYRVGVHNEAGMFRSAAAQSGDLFRLVVVGSLALVVVLAVSAVGAERGTVADSVLSRGISRYQYFLGKLHARLLLVLATYLAMCLVAMLGGLFLLHGEALTFTGSIVAIVTVAAVLMVVVTCGVSVSAVSTNTVVSIAIVWLALYGVGFLMSLLPVQYPSPDRALHRLPEILRGFYDLRTAYQLVAGSLILSAVIAFAGMILFSRRDV
jgi:ABC-2 type transport system permease protein